MPSEQSVIPNRKKLQVEYEAKHSIRVRILDGIQHILESECC